MTTNAQIIQSSFKLRISSADYEQICRQVAEHIAEVPGLVWKAWILNEARQEAGGVYLFESKEAADAFLEGPVISQLENNPSFADVRIKTFDLLTEPSAVTGLCVAAGA
jgi:hypothetical protein